MVEHDTQKDKYVTFKSGNEYFGLKIEYVNEIIVFQEITGKYLSSQKTDERYCVSTGIWK